MQPYWYPEPREEETLTSQHSGLLPAAAVLFAAGPTLAGNGGSDSVRCLGANSCKGRGACATANNRCAGQNACKGRGMVEIGQAECETAGGTVTG